MKKPLVSALFFSSVFCQNHLAYSEQLIDLGTYESYKGWGAFNHAPDMGVFIASLAKSYGITTVIETGTWLGYTADFLSLVFDEVHTIEISEIHYLLAEERLKNSSNVIRHFGSSEKVLHTILPDLQEQRLLFYLDAHWGVDWPLLNELEEIARTHKDNCLIIIDDFKIPDRPDISYDSYGGNDASFEYVKDKLSLIYSDYTYFYLISKDPNSRGKFVVMPKSLRPLDNGLSL